MNGEQFELELGRRVRQALDHGSRDLPSRVTSRLQQSRQQALARQRMTVAGLRLAGRFPLVTEDLMPHLRTLAAVTALVLGMAATYVWNVYQDADDIAQVDSALLADDLPVDAYTDPGFHAWLEASSSSSAQ